MSTVEASSPRGMGWALIGASTIAREFLVPAIRATGGRPLWVFSGDARHGQAFTAECGVENATDRLDVLLADPDVGAVYVSSINSSHHPQVLAAGRAGKHVLCDKPLATRSQDAVEMARFYAARGLVLATNHHLRSSAIHREMRARIEAGEIGEVRSLLIVHAGLLRPELQTWRLRDPAAGGGIYLDLTVHDIDLARFLLRQDPIEAVGLGTTMGLAQAGLDDHTSYAVRMSGGAFLQVHESFVTPNARSEVLALGSRGWLQAQGSIGQKPQGILLRSENGAASEVGITHEEPYAHTVRKFLEAIETGAQPLASGWDGVYSLTAAEAVERATRTGSKVSIENFAPSPSH